MDTYILVEAPEGGIGPGHEARAFRFSDYGDAVAEMARRIEEGGGGEYNEDFGNGYAESPFVAYEIFVV